MPMRSLLGALLVLSLLCPALTSAATYYIAPGGSNGNPCTSAQPCQTMAKGASMLSGGDTLILKDGVYAELLPNLVPSGSAAAPTIVRAEHQYGAIIRPTSCSGCYDGAGVITTDARSYITFDGLFVDAISLNATPYLFYVKNSSHITIQNCEIANIIYGQVTYGNGIVPGANASFTTVRNNKIHDLAYACRPNCTGGNSAYGMYNGGQDTLIEGNEFYRIGVFSIHGFNIVEGNEGSARAIIRNNRIHHNGWTILVGKKGNGNRVYNNLIYNNDGHGLELGGASPSDDNQIVNNTFYQNTQSCLYIGGASNYLLRNNICYGNGSDAFNIQGGSTGTADRNLNGTDPHFANAAAGDFHLTGASTAAVNQGQCVSYVTTDFDGDTRPQGGACDIGADEAGGPPALPAPYNLRNILQQ